MNRKKLLLLFVLGVLMCSAAWAVIEKSPTVRVRAAVDEVLTIVTDQSKEKQDRSNEIKAVINYYFDFQTMSQSILATNWQRASKEEKQRFVDFFSEYIEESYLNTISSYSGQEIRYVDEKVRGNRAVVDTLIITDKAEIPVNYKLRYSEGEWFAYDVVIENVSLVSNYRSTYSTMIQQEGMNGLLNNLQAKINHYKLKKKQQQ
ncbi:MAG: ABC transporter substrate-binding protein [gamma proteobacterium symbiont of Bathyaustriella thionipta]|nr:ABC transporter substrate-binding protein [gamma proteobacterium symbiont of Bathyaustriella thionipta]